MTLSHAFHEAGALPVGAQFGVGLALSVVLAGLWTLSNVAAEVLGQTRGLMGAWIGPWLRDLARWYLARESAAQPAVAAPDLTQHSDPGLLAAPEMLLLDVGPDEVDDDVSQDREPEPATVSEVFGPASFGWFELPHRKPDGPSRVELAQDIELVLTLASRLTRAAAEGGAP